jgi:hypothetical protein
MYLIRGYCPRTDIDMGRHGFFIDLHPKLTEFVALAKLTDPDITANVQRQGRAWLDSCGFDGWYDPDNYGLYHDPKKLPGPNAVKSYQPRDIRVAWGEWGPEHISVPGNACGLDIDRRPLGNIWRGGASLYPHNVDSWSQKQLLTIVFTYFIESVMLIAGKQE